MSTRRFVSAVAAAVGVTVGLAQALAAQTALDERQQHVATIVTGEIEKLTGANGRNCGIYTLTGGIDSPSPVGRREGTPASSSARARPSGRAAGLSAGAPHWPGCPHHFDQPLTYRDGWWYCERDAAFIAQLGRVSQAVPRVKRTR